MAASRALALAGLLACLAGCGSGDQPPSAIVGDWFTCLDMQCVQIGGVGNRFAADGSFVALYPRGQVLSAEDRYCVTSNADLIYSYRWDERELRVEDDGALLSHYTLIIDGARAEVINRESGKMLSMKRLTAPRPEGPCRDRVPWICPKFDKQDATTGSCTMTWVCDGGTHEVRCDASGGCSCARDGVAGKSFAQSGVCEVTVSQLSQLYATVNNGCGWTLSLLPF